MQTIVQPVVSINGVVMTYGSGETAVPALRGVDLDLERSSFTAVMGPSGSGKSTLLSCAAGIDRPTDGRIRIGGVELTDLDDDARTRLRRERIGIVFQHFHLMPFLTSEENVALSLRLIGRRVDRRRVQELLDVVGIADRAGRLPAELSGGQRQRVAIARALVTDPAVVLADEPTGALDSNTARGVLQLLRRSVDQYGQTVAMVTHDPVAAAFADRTVFLVDGRVAGSMDHPTAEAVAGQFAHLDDLIAGSR